MPHVRTSVHGLKTTVRSPFDAPRHLGRKGRLPRLTSSVYQAIIRQVTKNKTIQEILKLIVRQLASSFIRP